MQNELELGYLLAVAGAAVWTPRPLVAMLDILGTGRALVDFARDAHRCMALPCEQLGVEAMGRIAAIDDAAARRALAEAQEDDQRIVTSVEDRYPARLRHLCDPPPVLYYRGKLASLQERVVAIVGSRAATPYGRSIARTMAAEFAAFSATVISGLARGIDAAAHRAANEANVPTVAVIGSGLLALYPNYHSLLASEIVAKGGAVISEFPPKMAARQHHFPMRNRLVAALADATVVVEAGARSGALITARLAGDLGRPVFAVPGDVGRTTSEGSNALIKDGVALTTGAADIAAVLGWEACGQHARINSRDYMASDNYTAAPMGSRDCIPADDLASRLIAALAPGGSDVDEVCAVTGLDAATVSAHLTLLEMQGVVERRAGGLFSARLERSSR